jgi:hypothetical protein
MIEVECLDAIPAAVDEEEEMAVEEVLAEALLDEAREAVEALPHVDRSGAEGVRPVNPTFKAARGYAILFGAPP